MPRKGMKAIRVGLLVVIALVLAVAGILLIGGQNQLFTSKHEFYILFNNVGGLNPGNPVQLNGVDVGRVKQVTLPTDPGVEDIRVDITVESRYAGRVREDSQAAIKTLGLLGDKFIELTSGSTQAEPIPDGGQISTAPTTSIDELLSGGENMMDNVIAISFSLRNILAGMERGEGILGRLIADTPEAESLIQSVRGTVEAMERIADKVESGDGPLPRLLNDRQLASRVEGSLTRLENVLAKVDEGEGALSKLLNDPETAGRVDQTLAELQAAAAGLNAFVEEVESSEGLLQRLLMDEAYGEEVANRLRDVIEQVDEVSAQITEGDGTLARLIEDPAIYESVQDILVGINESKILRWLIRNRQKKGIEERYQEALDAGEVPPIPADEMPPPADEAVPPPELLEEDDSAGLGRAADSPAGAGPA